ncbi:hypothetical protein [Ferrimicrobium sp.]|uniref:hypothetical protein n=1 Tax=Ferrimicrobium sp. TaxID=2926050 RepID=UPI00260176DB|nr:hypothetical protein [Ferrimicrobium sp.]
MIDPEQPNIAQAGRDGDAEVVLFLVLRSSPVGMARALALRRDASIVELPALDAAQLAPDRTVEILAPQGSDSGVGELLRQGEIRILKGAPLLQEQAGLLREAVAARG